MDAASFTLALTTFAQEDPANVPALVALRQQAFEMITGGGGEIVQDISGTLNGKSFTFEVKYDCSQLFTILTQVLNGLTNAGTNNGRASSFDFSAMRQF